MNNEILTIKKLTKKYEDLTAVDNISFCINKGEVVGFIGPNGAGKTTTIKMIMGLVKPTSGDVFINSLNIKKDYEKALSLISGIVETPNFYPYLSGYDNLMLAFNMYTSCDKAYLSEIIKMVGLENRIKDKVRKYSLGMKQRLGIARSLLSRPEILILDEPINGLDIDGVIEFREMINNIVKNNNTTILISSHILAEVEKMCNRIIIIDKGKIKAPLQQSKDKNAVTYIIKSNDIDSIIKTAYDNLNIIPTYQNSQRIEFKTSKEQINKLLNILTTNNIQIDCFGEKELSLEESYIKLTKNTKE